MPQVKEGVAFQSMTSRLVEYDQTQKITAESHDTAIGRHHL